MWRKIRALALIAVCGVLSAMPGAHAEEPALQRVSYNWRNLAMGGGGYVTGLVAHPSARDVIYIRTDVGGAYRYSPKPDELGRTWVPITDGFTSDQWNYYGTESLAVDPSNPDVVYMAAGKYEWAGKGRLFVSRDRGKSWTALPLETPMAGGGANRHTGERLAVDPFNSKRVYFGSRKDGLLVSNDSGASWRKSGTLPGEPEPETGISFVQPDPFRRPGKDGYARIYIGLWGIGVAQSDDGGATWSLLGGVVRPARAAISEHGYVIVTGRDGVFRLDGKNWKDITPTKGKSYGAVSIDPFRPDQVAVSEISGGHQLPMYFSSHRGDSWKTLTSANGSITNSSDVPWMPKFFFASATSSLTFDPNVKDRLWFTDWYATWLTTNYRAGVPHFVESERGHEEMVIMTMTSPPKGAWLLSGTVDTNGFRHVSTDLYPDSNFNTGGLWQTFGLDYHDANPDMIIRVGTIGDHGDAAKGGVTLSSDNGRSFKALAWPYGQAMKAAYSATDPKSFVVLPRNDTPKSSNDGGVTWRESTGVEGNAIEAFWHWQHPLASDRVKGNRFYLYVKGSFYVSEDGGVTWIRKATLPTEKMVYVESVAGHAGWVFVALDKKGLFLSQNGGSSFQRVSSVKQARLFTTGKPWAYSDKPALYLYGQIEGSGPNEILRSNDLGKSWKIISVPDQPVGDEPRVMKGDTQTYGRVFIGTVGRGIYVGTEK